jgi:hypothetical protein
LRLGGSVFLPCTSDSIEAEIDDFFTDGVMSSGEVVGGIFFSGDQLFWVE